MNDATIDEPGSAARGSAAEWQRGVVDLPVLGMTCAACVRRVEKAVSAVEGVTTAEVNLPMSRARVGGVATPAAIAAAIRAAGYEVPEDVLDAARGGGAKLAVIEKAEREEVGALRRDAVIAIALAVPLIVVAMTGVLPATATVIVEMILGTLVVFGPGARYLRGGWRAVRHGAPDMNTLIALGAGAAWASSLVVAIRWLVDNNRPVPALYFEAGAAIVAFVMIGKVLEARARAQVSGAVRGLLALAPARAHRLVDGEQDVDASALVAGDRIAIRPGERLPADGTVISGASAVDEAMLTGESLPVDKAEGSPVYAGTLNFHGALVVRVARAGAETSLARIARAVEDAQGAKAPIARLADRVSAYFVPAVLAIAAGTFVAWWLTGHTATAALEPAIAVLVIACPCALGLATPAAVAVGTSRGAELGVLFAGGDALERASSIDRVCLDKTGTLTAGTPSLVGEVPDALLSLAASIEQASEHPIARAIVEAARARGLVLQPVTGAEIEPGGGITATLAGKSYKLGSPAFTGFASAARAAASEVQIVVDGALAGMLEIADPPAPTAKAAIARLRALGIDPVMVTGDRDAAAQWIAAEVGITTIHANVRPTGKARLVEELRAHHRVAMVGDGINDAPALAAADLGIALGSGADLAAAAADVTILHGGIATVPIAFALARATLHTIRRNLGAAFVYNLLCLPIAAAGLLSPMYAAAAMSLSSVTVLVSSLGLKRWQMR
ncbi:MAG: heavy metal translocating P-type ATPase [Kofleriaceae bacterium]